MKNRIEKFQMREENEIYPRKLILLNVYIISNFKPESKLCFQTIINIKHV